MLVCLSALPASASYKRGALTKGPLVQEPDMVPWGFFNLGTVQEVRDRLYKDAVADYVEMFKVGRQLGAVGPCIRAGVMP